MKKKVLGIVLICSLVFFVRSCVPMDKNKLEDKIIMVPVLVKKQSQRVNAVQIDLRYSKNLMIEKMEKNKSFFKYVLEDKVNDSDGWIRLSGGLPFPGHIGEDLELVRFYFRYSGVGEISISLMPSSLVLLNDGKGSNVVGKLGMVKNANSETIFLDTYRSQMFNTTEMILGASWQKQW